MPTTKHFHIWRGKFPKSEATMWKVKVSSQCLLLTGVEVVYSTSSLSWHKRPNLCCITHILLQVLLTKDNRITVPTYYIPLRLKKGCLKEDWVLRSLHPTCLQLVSFLWHCKYQSSCSSGPQDGALITMGTCLLARKFWVMATFLLI